jgi:predicted alpha/beta superfamily hydrolase
LLSKTGADLHFRSDPHGHHREASWRRRFLPAVRFLVR